MKKFVFIILTIIFVSAVNVLYAQPTVKLYIVNQTASGTDFFFEIQMEATSGTLYLAGADLILTFNSGNFTNPVTTRSASTFWSLLNSNGNDVTSLGANLGASYRGLTSPAAITSNEIILNVNSPTFIDQDEFNTNVAKITNTKVSFGQYKISNITNFAGKMGLAWKTGGGGLITRILNYSNTTPWGQGDAILDVSFPIADAALPVELTTFTASVSQNTVTLNWITQTEVNNYGFEVERTSSMTSSIQGWEKIGFVAGNGNSNSPKDYSFIDFSPSGGSKFIYRLKQIDNNGKFEYSNEVEIELALSEFVLYQNYPNPFNPSTKIQYALNSQQYTSLKVYDVLGNEMQTLVDEVKPAGLYEVTVDAANFPSGIYFYKLRVGAIVETKKMTLLR